MLQPNPRSNQSESAVNQLVVLHFFQATGLQQRMHSPEQRPSFSVPSNRTSCATFPSTCIGFVSQGVC